MNFTLAILFLIGYSPAFGEIIIRAGCSASLNNDLGSPQPLVLIPENIQEGIEAYFWPTNGDVIYFNEDEIVLFSCPGGILKYGGSSTGSESAEGICNSGLFKINSENVAFNKITCSQLPYHTARYTGNSCNNNNKEIEIGFELEDRFITDITLCFDKVNQSTLYTVFTMTKSIEGYQIGFARPNFIQGSFYNVGSTSVEKLYKRDSQRKVVNSLVGLPSASNKYVSESNDYFMSRGHLAAKADFVYGSQQRFTFHYVNVAPQWQTFNGGNWNTLEQDIRHYVGKGDSNIVIYSGSHGITTLPHEETGEDIELWLYLDGNKKGIPVPQIIWRVLYDPDIQAGVAFVGINNPYHNDISNEIFCQNICDQLDWLTWKPNDIVKGYSYCCDVNELRKIVNSIPDFTVTQILK